MLAAPCSALAGNRFAAGDSAALRVNVARIAGNESAATARQNARAVHPLSLQPSVSGVPDTDCIAARVAEHHISHRLMRLRLSGSLWSPYQWRLTSSKL